MSSTRIRRLPDESPHVVFGTEAVVPRKTRKQRAAPVVDATRRIRVARGAREPRGYSVMPDELHDGWPGSASFLSQATTWPLSFMSVTWDASPPGPSHPAHLAAFPQEAQARTSGPRAIVHAHQDLAPVIERKRRGVLAPERAEVESLAARPEITWYSGRWSAPMIPRRQGPHRRRLG